MVRAGRVRATRAARRWHTSGVRVTRPGRTGGPLAVRAGALALAPVLLLAGCSDDDPVARGPQPQAPAPTQSVSAEDISPAQRALPHVPLDGVAAVTVTDFDRAALQLGVETPSSDLPQADKLAFWDRAQRETAILSDGLLRPVGPELLKDYSFAQEDVGWEARLFDADGQEVGWILGLHAIIDPLAVEEAVDAGVGPLDGAVVDVEDGLVLSGAAIDVTESWADDDATGMLVTGSAVGTYVERGCVPAPDAAAGLGLEPLAAYSVALEGTLATVRLGEDRGDLFDRVELGADDPDLARAFEGGVADPGSGRIGYRLVDPVEAADLTLRRSLPFAACAD